MNRRLLAVIMSFAVVFSMCCSFAFPSESDSTEEVDVVCVDSAGDMNKVSESADVVVLEDAELYEEIDSGVIEENLDNGTVIVVDNIGEEQTEEVCDIFDIDLEEENLQENDAVKAVYVKADGAGGYSSTPVVASIEPLDGMEIDDEELDRALDDAVEEDVLDVDLLYYQIDEGKNIAEMITLLPEEGLARLQASSPTENAFLDDQREFILYGWNGRAGYVGNTDDDSKSSKGDKGDDYNKDDQPSHWVKASVASVKTWVSKIKTTDNVTYDCVYAYACVDPTKTFKVEQYNFKLTTGSSDRYSILDYSNLPSGKKTHTISVNISGGKGGISGGASYEYSWNANDQTIDTEIGERGYWWRCTPSSPSKDHSFYVKPYIEVKSKKGTEKTTYCYATLSYQNLVSSKYGRVISDRDRKITMKFKKHKTVE